MKVSLLRTNFQGSLYCFLFACSLCLINPWGESRGQIWTEPKVLLLNLITALNIVTILRSSKKDLIVPFPWKTVSLLWTFFLIQGFITTLASPFPLRSLWGESTLGDGWAYWVTMAAFFLSNTWLILIKPTLLRTQLYGILIGGGILALSILPQMLDWHIDYTSTSGQTDLLNPEMLKSTIWHRQMPVGFYSNRGHAAYVLAVAGILTLLSVFWRWVTVIPALFLYTLLTIALVCTQTRSGVLATLVATVWLLKRFGNKLRALKLPKYFWIIIFINLLLLVCYTFFRSAAILPTTGDTALTSYKNLESFSTGRFHLWLLSLKGIFERISIGWGFDGFGIAFPFIADWTGSHRGYLPPEKIPIEQIVSLQDFTFKYLGVDGKFYTGILMTNKAHNFLLDTSISIGLLGLSSYLFLLIHSVKRAMNSIYWGIETVALVFIVYALTWYDSAQFGHLLWWSLSAGFTINDCTRY
jgi:hypothetical protein